MKIDTGGAWHNTTRDQECRPAAICWPESEADLVALVRDAERDGLTVHAVGSGHAWSKIALTEGLLVMPDGLRGVGPVDDESLRPRIDTSRLVRVAGGTPLSELNASLYASKRALVNMGGFDAQTIAGVLSTSTHGSGLAWGPFPSMVRSLDLVVSGGEIVRVEPDGGMSDPDRFARAHGNRRKLIADNDTFNAAICGLGVMGLLASVVIEVREKFWLKEVRTLDTWESLRDRLTPAGILAETDEGGRPTHYELLVNPYADLSGAHRVLVTRRSECPDPGGLPPDLRERHPLTELASQMPVVWHALGFLARHFPGWVAGRFDDLLRGMCGSYTNVSYRVFNIGAANDVPAYSMELGFSLADNAHLEAVDRILDLAAQRRREKGWFHTCPISLRFVAPTQALMSMMHGQPTMMVELIMIADTRSGRELLAGYEADPRLQELGMRPHWGQFNTLTAERVRMLYPQLPTWRERREQLCASGVFNTALSRSLDL